MRHTRPGERAYTIRMGFAAIVDGLVRVLSLGHLSPALQLEVARRDALRRMKP